jgi:hypothetical protein
VLFAPTLPGVSPGSPRLHEGNGFKVYAAWV